MVDLEYGKIEALTEEENYGLIDVPYEINFALSALSHRDLTINFAFSANFYMVLYLLVGVLSIGIMVVFATYHRLVARPPPNQPIAKPKFTSYLRLTIPPAAYGTGMGMFPVLIADVFIAVAIVGEIFMVDTSIYECTEAEGGVVCPLTLLDGIKPDPYSVSTNYLVMRTGRCGVALITTGLYLMRAGMIILIPDKTEYGKVNEAYDGNSWDYFTWKRVNMIYVSTFLLSLCLAVIQFSFSDLFGEQIWVSIALLKVMAIIVESFLSEAMDEDLLTAPLAMVLNVVLGLVTFGADNFLDFLSAFFIELGIMIFERTYLGQILEQVEDFKEHKMKEIKDIIMYYIKTEDDGLDEEEERLAREQKEKDRAAGIIVEESDDSSKTSGSELNFSTESTFKDEQSGLDEEDPDILLNNPDQSENQDSLSGELSNKKQMEENELIDKEDFGRRQRE